jgi:DNA-binding MarR family transcriptional regulator
MTSIGGVFMYESYDQSVGILTNVTNKKLVRYLNTNLERFNITTEQWIVLLKLSGKNKISQKSLAEIVNKDQPTLTRILDILEKKSLIERHPNEKDRRCFVLHITEKGTALKEKIEPFLENVFEVILQGIPSENLNMYTKVLLQLNENIDNAYSKNK